MTDSSNQRIGGRQVTKNENFPTKMNFRVFNRVADATDNILSPSFNKWTNGVVGAVQIGDYVKYWIGTSSPVLFCGRITSIEQGRDGWVDIEAYDDAYQYEHLKPNKTSFTSYRDNAHWWYLPTANSGAKYLHIHDIDSTAVIPGVAVEFACNDRKFQPAEESEGDNWHTLNAVDEKIAQPFIADFDGTYSFGIYYNLDNGPWTLNARIGIQEDSGGYPSGQFLFYRDIVLHTTEGTYWYDYSWQIVGSEGLQWSCIQELKKGQKYWLVVAITSWTEGDIRFRRASGCKYSWNGFSTSCLIDEGSGWNALSGSWVFWVSAIDYEKIAPENYIMTTNGSHYDIDILKFEHSLENLGTEYVFVGIDIVRRGRVSYYYGNDFTLATLVSNLASFGLMSGTPSIDSNADKGFKLHRTKGKTLGEAFRELADIYGISSGSYQSCYGVYYYNGDPTAPRFTWQRRHTSNDTPACTFSYGPDASADNERVIMSCTLRKTCRLKPNTVTVIGRSLDGGVLVATRDDRSKADSMRAKAGFPITESIQDDSLTTLQECHDRAWAILDSQSYEVWEGTIVVSGFWDVWGGDVTSPQCCQGRIITLNYSPLGITNQKFKVKGTVWNENTTEITITSTDRIIENWLRAMKEKTWRTESFASTQDEEEIKTVSVWKNATLAAGTYYMQLSSAAGTPITGCVRQKCTVLASSSANNTYTFHAEFGKWNGYGTVKRIELYDAQVGGNLVSYYDFATEYTAAAEVYKSKRCYLIVAYNTRMT